MSEIDDGHSDDDQQPPLEEKWARFLQTANLGRVVVTPAAAKVLDETETEAMVLLWRHATGDWGQVEQDEDPRDRRRSPRVERQPKIRPAAANSKRRGINGLPLSTCAVAGDPNRDFLHRERWDPNGHTAVAGVRCNCVPRPRRDAQQTAAAVPGGLHGQA